MLWGIKSYGLGKLAPGSASQTWLHIRMPWRARADTGGGLYLRLQIQLLLDGDLRNCIFNMFPGDADAAGVGSPLWGLAALGGKDQSEKKTEGSCKDCWVVARESEEYQESMLSWKSGEDCIFFFSHKWGAVSCVEMICKMQLEKWPSDFLQPWNLLGCDFRPTWIPYSLAQWPLTPPPVILGAYVCIPD